MKLSVNQKQLGESPELWLRRAGYIYLPSRDAEPDSFARRLTRDFYPRFHVYFNVEMKGEQTMVIFNLHLDQKKPGYAGQNRHNAEYDGALVEQEAARLNSLLLPDFFI
ncbi:hypothetical protein GW920_00315 [Candidatus Falkowbacteria bacterium]|uniref:Uncharacterized protein n=1 Tax=Candidatus Falkowbacteria bacterium CG10_big_fil_rev_8_21_14_0_10_37_18 TaxID=1974562 RepID=A0A2H0V8K3_9BACT|nr:hypothetical protein [Candidatus Falkowbacteria bacterium]NCQ13089.1 hypothetical protein [Candidatus Falkowbacteria bacterium]OIO05716.1 MAG: hypothetical protein AUJ26_02525 [Candidatus Falkowbacteria bacterium CG1_02_37_21]PIR95415.1 MAG: hypothetical protein COT93_02490 [Candidatus Falkowbacteria bacterium CG10_big_fil_rev_8_21_14_0_10_37_18]